MTARKKTIHPLADLFPRMTPAERDALKDSMERRGFDPAHPIVLLGGKVYDGRHRYDVALELGIEPVYIKYAGNDPEGDVLATNAGARRSLTTGQKAMVALGALEVSGLNSGRKSGRAAEEVAKLVGVGRDSINKAKRIKAEQPELAQQVFDGELNLNAAWELLTMAEPPKVEQPELTDPVGPAPAPELEGPGPFDLVEAPVEEVVDHHDPVEAPIEDAPRDAPDPVAATGEPIDIDGFIERLTEWLIDFSPITCGYEGYRGRPLLATDATKAKLTLVGLRDVAKDIEKHVFPYLVDKQEAGR